MEWVPLQQSSTGVGGLTGLHMLHCIREIPGTYLVGAHGQGQGENEGERQPDDERKGVCVMYTDGYYALFSDRSLGDIDFETAAKGFVGIGEDGGLKVYGYVRGHPSQADEQMQMEKELPRSVLQGDVPPLLLGDGLVVTARYGRLPRMQTDNDNVEDVDGQEQLEQMGEGALLEVVDAMSGVLREMAGMHGVPFLLALRIS